MSSDDSSFARIGVHVGQDWWTHLSTYPGRTPILGISAGSTSVTFTIAGQQATEAGVEFARKLARQTAEFAAEMERLYTASPDSSGVGGNGAPDGEAA